MEDVFGGGCLEVRLVGFRYRRVLFLVLMVEMMKMNVFVEQTNDLE